MAEVSPTAKVDMMPSAVCSKKRAREMQSARVRVEPEKMQAHKRKQRITYNSAGGNGETAHIRAFLGRLTNT